LALKLRNKFIGL